MREARLIVERLQLRNAEINGQKLDLRKIMAGHPSRGRHRVMVMQAVTRLLSNRGARTNIAKMDVKRRRHPKEQ